MFCICFNYDIFYIILVYHEIGINICIHYMYHMKSCIHWLDIHASCVQQGISCGTYIVRCICDLKSSYCTFFFFFYYNIFPSSWNFFSFVEHLKKSCCSKKIDCSIEKKRKSVQVEGKNILELLEKKNCSAKKTNVSTKMEKEVHISPACAINCTYICNI